MKKIMPVLLQEKGQNRKKWIVLEKGSVIGIALVLLAGTAGTLAPLFSHGGTVLFLGAGGITAAALAVSQRNRRLETAVSILCLALAFAVVFVRMDAVTQGILSMVNECLERWNQTFHTYYTVYSVLESGREESFPAAFVLGIFAGVFFECGVWRRRMVFVSGAVFVLLAGGCLLQLFTGAVPAILLAGGWFGIWARTAVRGQKGRQISLTVCVLALLAGALVNGSLAGYQPSSFVASVKERAEEAIGKLRFGEDSLPQGDLTKAGEMLKNGEKKKTLQLSFQTVGAMYLKGFVGVKYDGKAWTPLSSEAYEGRQRGMLDWLENQEYNPVFAYAASRKNSGNTKTTQGGGDIRREEKEENAAFQVVNNGADRRYVYVPAETDGVAGVSYKCNQDWQLTAKGFRGAFSYEFSCILEDDPAGCRDVFQSMYEKQEKTTGRFAEAEKTYRSFVYKNYLDVSKKEKQMFRRLFFSGDGWEEDKNKQVSIYEATSRIRVMLGLLADYEETPEEVPEDKDFASWFLQEYRKGNAVHFATAAALAYRTLGIPARYVEGYCVDAALAEQLKEEGANQVQLTEKNGHAWTEIYIDKTGWVPVEVTPGYYEEEKTPEKFIGTAKEKQEKAKADISKRSKTNMKKAETAERERKEQEEQIPWNKRGIFVFAVLAGTGIIVLLEGQRAVRRRIGKRKNKKKLQTTARIYYEEICKIAACAGIQRDKQTSYAAVEEIVRKFPEIRKEEYFRVIRVAQREVFGEKKLLPDEQRTLRIFCEKMRNSLYKNASVRKKIWYRYVDAV